MAEAGFQLMSGRDKAGKNISGRPFLSQVGSALGTYTGGRAKDLEADRSRDLAIKTLAYKQAAGQQQFERQAASTLNQAMLGAAAKNLFDPGDYSISTIANADGSETPVRINKKTGTVATVPMGAVRQDIISFGSGKEGDYIRVFGLESPAYGLGTMNKTNVDVFEQGLSTYLNPVTQEGGVSVFENALPKSLAKTILQRLENSELATNLDQRIINEARRVAAVSEQEAFFEAAENINKAPLLIKPGMEFEQSFDALASVKGGLNNMLIYGASFGNFRPEAINSARIANEAALTTLLNRTRMMFREDLVGKPFASDAEMLLKEVSVLDPSTVFTNSELAYAQAQAMKTIIQKMKADRDNILGNVAASESDRAAAEKMKGPLEWMEDNFENLIKGFTRINGDILRTQKRLNVPVSKPITPVITDEEIVELDGL